MSARDTTDPECAVIHFIVSHPSRVELTAHTVARLNITSLRAPKVDSGIHRPLMKCKRRLLVWVTSISFGIVCIPLHALQVKLTTEVEGGFQPMVKATSNLPDGMKLLVRVTRKEVRFNSRRRSKCNRVISKSARSRKVAVISIPGSTACRSSA